jgi:hypothetical protein
VGAGCIERAIDSSPQTPHVCFGIGCGGSIAIWSSTDDFEVGEAFGVLKAEDLKKV